MVAKHLIFLFFLIFSPKPTQSLNSGWVGGEKLEKEVRKMVKEMKVTEEWEVVPKDGKNLYEMLEEMFRSLGWSYVYDSRDIEYTVYVHDIDEDEKKIYVSYCFTTPSTRLVWNRDYYSPSVEIARYRADIWDIEQTYVDREKGVWYNENGEPSPIEEFIEEVAGDFAMQELPDIEEGAREIAEEILRYEYC